ncbi:hypothetical protein QBC46DRAFT_460664 [Diplogelasinospora grovesii]|uniref:FAD-binding domain-containing protein n=1 Tax=Diplogelasinospora grovesii TaxID=303347 RepID=A0AAN6N2Y1_9PEZI|nr:hypothetical protein QBC46DRAFT_460664 [Diplogelasinospora grovesii]
MDDKIRTAIIGGGISGLALAAGLHKHPHLSVHVDESVPAYRDVGAGLALHLNAIQAMSLIGPEVRQAYFNKVISISSEEDEEMSTQVILSQGPNAGTLVAELGRAKGRKSVSRADLLSGFLELVPKTCITFGRKLVNISQTTSGVRIEFSNGQQEDVDCDAINKYYIDPKWTKTVPILLGPRGHVNVIPLNKGTRLNAGVAVRGGCPASPDAPHNSATTPDPGLYADYTEDAQKIVRMVAGDTSASWKAGDHDHAPYYCRGRAAMMGDAAHASLPFAGNGAAQALEDAAVLSHLFQNVSRPEEVEAALRAYDQKRRPSSQAVLYAYVEEDDDGVKIREDPERPRQFFAAAAAFTNNADLKRQNDDACALYQKYLDQGKKDGSAEECATHT